jgi:hypothetical protein
MVIGLLLRNLIMSTNLYRAVVAYSDQETGTIKVRIPAKFGSDTTVPISYYGRTAPWDVPDIGKQVVVGADDESFTNVFIINVVPAAPNATLDDISDVTITTATSGDLLKWNGSSWVNAAGYSLLDSPTFTGIPTAPTASAGNNSTQIATTAYTDAAVAAIVDSAPATLNTLDELAAALGDDTNFATTTATAIGLKAPLASPTFTGTPTLPTGTIATTQTSGNNTTAVATTAFVTTAVSSLPRGVVAYVRQESGGGGVNSMGGGIVTLSGQTTTFTPVAGRLYRCTYSIGSLTQSVNPGLLEINLRKEYSSTLHTSNLFEDASVMVSHTHTIILTSSELGTSPTYLSLSAQTTHSVSVTNSSVRPTIIIVEDIGPA